MQLVEKQIKDGAISQKKLNLTPPVLPNDAVRKVDLDSIKDYVDQQDLAQNASLEALAKGLTIKVPCRAATVGNINLSGTQTIDDVVLNVGERVLVKNQTTAKDNGIYIVSASAWTRSLDANSTALLPSGSFVMVTEGTANKDTGFTLVTDNITLGTTSLAFEIMNLMKTAVPFKGNLGMTALVTVSDGDAACATTLLKKPLLGGSVSVFVSGLRAGLGDGVKTKDCYFSDDLGATAKTLENLASGDKLYWNGSIAGFQLDAGDVIDFEYNA
jgi:hypothetical protein